MRRCTLILLGSGLAVVTLGILFGMLLFPGIIQKKIRQQINLDEHGDLFNRWVDVKIPIFMKVYIFTVQNPEEFTQGLKPILTELGPYVYEQKRQKVVESVSVANDTLKFRPKITYFFRPDLSTGSESDEINFINVPFVSIAAKSLEMGFVSRSLIKEIVDTHKETETLFVRRTVGQLLFEGYHIPMVQELSELKGEEIMPNNSFGFYYGKNGTAQDLLEIYSGVKDNTKFGSTVSWRGQSEIGMWDTEYCNMINGTDGSIFPPFVERDRNIQIFSPDMCRSIYMTYTEDVVVNGLPGYTFATPKGVLEDPRTNPDNLCYCKNPKDDELSGCTKSGVFRMAECRKGAPIVASWPHFFDGDEEYQQQSIGLQPDKDKHQTSLTLEPNTAALLQAYKRFQVNLELKPTKYYTYLKKVPSMLLPLIWIDESVRVPEETAQMLQKKLLTPIKIGTLVMFGLLGLGALLIVIALVMMVLPGRKGKGKIRESNVAYLADRK